VVAAPGSCRTHYAQLAGSDPAANLAWTGHQRHGRAPRIGSSDLMGGTGRSRYPASGSAEAAASGAARSTHNPESGPRSMAS
jgi:hypothetical protein